MIKFLFITNDPQVAAFALQCGVDRIFVDLEFNGKLERQGHLDTLISRHRIEDVAMVRAAVVPGRLLVRVNPLHEGTPGEVEQVLAAGADIIMLPMFRCPAEVEAFTRIVAKRARTCLLVETVGAMESLAECVQVPGVDEVHIGLNDLHLELRRRFMFEPLAEGTVDHMAAVLRDAKIPFGIGGVARVGEGLLPAELLLGEHARLGSSAAILSRTFHRQAKTVADIQSQMDFAFEVRKLRDAYAEHLGAGTLQLESLHEEVRRRVHIIAEGLPQKVSRVGTGRA